MLVVQPPSLYLLSFTNSGDMIKADPQCAHVCVYIYTLGVVRERVYKCRCDKTTDLVFLKLSFLIFLGLETMKKESQLNSFF